MCFMYMKPHSTFKELLLASMLAEKESTPNNMGCARAVTENVMLDEIASIKRCNL